MAALLDAVVNFFSDKLIEDDRVPTILFPNLLGYQIGLLPLKMAFQYQIVALIVGQIAFSNVLALITWYGVVVPMKRQHRTLAWFMAFGIVIPASCLLPMRFIDLVDLRSKSLRFGCIFLPTLIPFKCLDALFGVESPDRTTRFKSIQHYMYYMGFMLLPKFSAKNNDDDDSDKTSQRSGRRVVVPMTIRAAMRAHNGFLGWFLVTSAIFPILFAVDSRPFVDSSLHQGERDPAFDIYPTFQFARIYNSYFQAIVFFLTLLFSLYGVALICCLLGNMQVDDSIFDRQPMFCAKSPSDFWGRRWNALVHHNLKEGIYLPMRAWVGWTHKYSKPLAVVATFVTSGLLHEYVWALLFFRTSQEISEGDTCETCYDYLFGKHLIFFGWNGLLIVLEHSEIGKILGKILGDLQLPAPIHSHLVVLTALPVAHLFMEDLIDSGYFTHLRVALPLLTIERV